MTARPSLRRPTAIALSALALAGGAAAVAAADDVPTPDGSDPVTLGPADALDVAVAPDGSKVLRTADGRTVRLRGANVNALVDYGGVHDTVPVTPADGAQARALGLSVVRLAVSWSRIAPRPGAYDTAYLDEIRTAARAFTDQGVRVLLDLHQDRYAAGLGPSGDESDGAPAWAAATGGASTAAGSGGHPYYGTAASRTAAQAFFTNATLEGKGLQEHYADALVRLAAVGEDLGPGLAGVELYNEPVDPVGTDPAATDTFSPTRLWPLYRRLIDRLRGPDGTGAGAGAYDGPIWFEPQATRTQTDSDAVAASFSDDPDLVYAPHVYTDVFNGQIGQGTYAKLERSFDDAAREARRYGAALAPSELPGASTGPWELHRAEVLRHLDRLDVGGMVWVWKQAPGADYGWGVLRADGGLRPESGIARDYGRARLRSSSTASATSAWADGTLTVRTTGAGTVELWDGARFGTTAPVAGAAPVVTVDGRVPPAGTLTGRRAAAPLSSATEWAGGRELRLTVPAGDHTVVLRPAAAGESATPAPAPGTGTTTTAPEPSTTTTPTTTTPTTTTPTTTAPAPPTTTTTTTPEPPTTTTPATPAPAADPVGAVVGGLGGLVGNLAGAVLDPLRPLVGAVLPPARPGSAVAAAPARSTRTALPPAVSAVRASPTRFRPAAGGRGGTRVRVVAPSATRLRVALQRRDRGVRSGGRCVAATRRPGTASTSCVRWTVVTTQTRRVATGRTVVPVSGRAKGRALPAGSYRAVVTPTAGSAVGRARSVALTVLPTAR
ncbi:unannotated protein [freshwater metagenome]|uniref:Unannotated protein n=1 Tax=freshwater metagenome TaxID=449393 RepID=A0A6J7JYV8_9ZZZZ